MLDASAVVHKGLEIGIVAHLVEERAELVSVLSNAPENMGHLMQEGRRIRILSCIDYGLHAVYKVIEL